MMKTYLLPRDITQVEQDGYAAGMQAALVAKSEAATSSEAIEAIAHDTTKEVCSASETNDTSLFYQTYQIAFCVGYVDAVVMRKNKPEHYNSLVLLDYVEQVSFCSLLAYIWQTTIKNITGTRKTMWLNIERELQN